jgi:hypothetical protein
MTGLTEIPINVSVFDGNVWGKLIDAVGAATEPSRVLDARIRHLVYGDFVFCNSAEGSCCGKDACSETGALGCGAPIGMFDGRSSYPVNWQEDPNLPRYTALIDDAFSLFPQLGNTYWELEWKEYSGKDYAQIPVRTPNGSRWSVGGNTPTLAVVRAALVYRAVADD